MTEEKEKNHQRELVNMTIEVAELERKRIAANLHDDVGGAINLAKINILRMGLTSDPEEIKELGKESSDLLEITMDNIRTISRNLAPSVLFHLGFEEGIIELCRHINASGVLKVEFTGTQNEFKLPAKTELQLYRIINETLNNILKHSGASLLWIDLVNFKDKFSVIIKHNGKGVDNDTIKTLTAESKGIGLKSIQSRAEVINASINYLIKTPGESSVIIDLPL